MSVHVTTPDMTIDHPEAEKWTVDEYQQVHVIKTAEGKSETVASYAAGQWLSVHRNRFEEPSIGAVTVNFQSALDEKAMEAIADDIAGRVRGKFGA